MVFGMLPPTAEGSSTGKDLRAGELLALASTRFAMHGNVRVGFPVPLHRRIEVFSCANDVACIAEDHCVGSTPLQSVPAFKTREVLALADRVFPYMVQGTLGGERREGLPNLLAFVVIRAHATRELH